MHIISRKRLKDAIARHNELEIPLNAWFRVAKRASWKSLAEVRQTYPSADAVDRWTVFNIKGNQYRLIVVINYVFSRIYVRHVLTHSEYDRGRWKQ